MAPKLFQVISPIDGSVYAEREYADMAAIDEVMTRAERAFRRWRKVPLAERIAICTRFADALAAQKEELGLELTWQMGRPIRYTPKEVETCAERARTMIALAEDGLASVQVSDKPGFTRRMDREPLGVVWVVPAWNYPYLITVNSVVPALLAGNSVILKHSAQTPLVAERFGEAFHRAGLPEDVLQVVHADHPETGLALGDPRTAFVAFTGSVAGGHAVSQAAAQGFAGVGLELGGKDPAYVRGDADIAFAVENLVDGSFFNSGQSCCGIERIYVHASVHDEFVERFVSLSKTYVLGDPRHEDTTLGPMTKLSGADTVREQIREALRLGAHAHLSPTLFPRHEETGQYVAPQVLTGVNHSMRVMTEESFGPVVGIMCVENDAEAVERMNDSVFGLTASIWSQDEEAAARLATEVETGTVFLNRCDFLDPELAWVGVKDSGRGCSLSRLGYEQLTRPKSYHFRRPC